MKETPLVLFTLLAQTAAGAFATLLVFNVWSGYWFEPITTIGCALIFGLMVAALAAAFLHLGAPLGAWRAVGSLSTAWLSREIASAMLFTAGTAICAALTWRGNASVGALLVIFVTTAAMGLALVYTMSRIYRLRTVPAWDTGITPATFFATAGLLGALGVGALLLVVPVFVPAVHPPVEALWAIMLWAAALTALQLLLLPAWLARLTGSEAAQAAFERLTVTHGRALRVRMLTALLALVVLVITLLVWDGDLRLRAVIGFWLAFGLALISETLGRVLFYAARVRIGI